jgi:hypothetical protein
MAQYLLGHVTSFRAHGECPLLIRRPGAPGCIRLVFCLPIGIILQAFQGFGSKRRKCRVYDPGNLSER